MIYLDSAATTLQKPKAVSEAVKWAMLNLGSPGRGQYYPAAKSEEIVYNCRVKAAKLFNISEPDKIVFTFNATHALNIAINTLAYPGCRVVVSGYEHNAVIRPLRYAGAMIDVVNSQIFDNEQMLLFFEEKTNRKTDFVVCTAMSNVFGYILPVYEIAEICKKKNIPLIIDASQAAGTINLDFSAFGAAFMACPGHKGLYGPQGTGILVCGREIKPLLSGGTGGSSRLKFMPEYLPDAGEAGTHNVPGIAGLSAGIDYVLRKSPSVILKHEKALCGIAVNGLKKFNNITTYHSRCSECQGGTFSFTVQGAAPEVVAEKLAKRGVCVRAGLHCAPLAHETADTVDKGTIRVSFSAFNTVYEVQSFLKILEENI